MQRDVLPHLLQTRDLNMKHMWTIPLITCLVCLRLLSMMVYLYIFHFSFFSLFLCFSACQLHLLHSQSASCLPFRLLPTGSDNPAEVSISKTPRRSGARNNGADEKIAAADGSERQEVQNYTIAAKSSLCGGKNGHNLILAYQTAWKMGCLENKHCCTVALGREYTRLLLCTICKSG